MDLADFQREDIIAFLDNNQTAWRYGRGCGKTTNMSHLAVFGALLGKEVLWMVPQWSMLEQPYKYWTDNPFVEFVPHSPTNNTVRVYGGGNIKCISARESTEKQVRSRRGEWVMYDEVAQMNEYIFNISTSCADHVLQPKFLYASTPVLHSLFHRLCERDNVVEIHRTYLDCAWMNHDRIEQKKKVMPLWLWRQEHMATFEKPAGAVFARDGNIVEFKGNPPDCVRIRQGVDFGGGKPHTMVRIGEFGGKIYILGEWEFDPRNPLEEQRLTEMAALFPTEAEIGGSNNAYIHLTPYADKVPFTEKTKYDKFNYLIKNTIAINPALTPKTYRDINNASYDDKGKIDTHELDYLSALLHAGDMNMSIVDTPQPNPYRRRRKHL